MKAEKRIYLMECLKIVYKVDFIPALSILVLKVLLALVPTFQTLVIAGFINRVTQNHGNLMQEPYIKLMIFLMVGFIAYTWFGKSLIELLEIHVEMKVKAKFKPTLVEKISQLEYRFMEDADTRDKINRVNSEVDSRIKNAYMEMLKLMELILKALGILIMSCYNSIVTDLRNKKTKEPRKMKKYNAELKETIVRLHLSEGRSMASLEKEYNLSKGCVSNWVKSYNKECQNNEEKINEKEHFSQLLELKKEVEELKKENLFLKKAAAFFAKEI